jgi:hypothetical protein
MKLEEQKATYCFRGKIGGKDQLRTYILPETHALYPTEDGLFNSLV